LGFSPGVAERIARLRPDVIENAQSLPPEKAHLQGAFVVHRGLHNITLRDFKAVTPYAQYVDAQGHWAVSYVTDRPGVVPPGPEQLYRGFLLQLEVPGHFFPNLRDVVAQQFKAGESGFVETLAVADAPDLRPFISKVGFAGPDKQIKFYPYEELFNSAGGLTPLAERLSAQMVEAPPN
jgi:hypothetical protein